VVKKWFEKLKSEEITWLSQQLLEGRFPVSEICKLFGYKFPGSIVKFTTDDLRLYAKRNLIGWSEDNMPKDLEDEIEKQSVFVDTTEKHLLDSEDQNKINAIRTHRRILAENWENYMSLKSTGSENENAKAGYLDRCSRELTIIQSLEETEKSLISMLSEVKKAEEEETAEDLVDYIVGYCWPLLILKVGGEEKISEEDIARLKDYLKQIIKKTSFTFTITSNGVRDKSEINKIYMRKLYELKPIAPSSVSEKSKE